ncbi:MAG: carboxypeptidase regulatory-like domain-containing protein [Armatimonadota bacterium]|nr:carboxypeptidase regulatory-like domain-containing protein [Armatimonadota bacterium]
MELNSDAALNKVKNEVKAAARKDEAIDEAVDTKKQPVYDKDTNILMVPVETDAPGNTKQRLRAKLKSLPNVRRVVRTFGKGRLPMVETTEILIRFKNNITRDQAAALVSQYGGQLVQPLGRFASNGYLVRVKNPATNSSIALANALYTRPEVMFSHPNFIYPLQKRIFPANDPLTRHQWHLHNIGQNVIGGSVPGPGKPDADIDAPEAWDFTRGSPRITIAVIDDSVDTDHEDFQEPGKIVPGFDFRDHDNDPRPADPEDNHGTSVAGLSAAVGGNNLGVSGVAPHCRIMPIRLIGGNITLLDIADSFRFAADNGADVINNSWGPGDTSQPVPLPDVVRAAFDYATTNGRNGRGCVILFAAGNSFPEPGDNDGFAAYPRVISVGATTKFDTRSFYSQTGTQIDVSSPGGDAPGDITTTDRMGPAGYNAGGPPEFDLSGNYTYSFNGTSAACPNASGVAALVLSINPGLTYTQVRQRLIQTADKINFSATEYDATGHSRQYGFGRVNALRAVQITMQDLPFRTISGRVTLSNGTPVPGVEVTADTTGSSGLTANDGTYIIRAVRPGVVTITPNKVGYGFIPTTRTVNVVGNVLDQNFIAVPPPRPTLLSPANSAVINTSPYPLRAVTENDAAVSELIFERRGQAVSFTRSPGLEIPDLGSVTDASDPLTASGTIENATVEVNITHRFSEDLIITLIAPDGTRHLLYNQNNTGPGLAATFTVPTLRGKPIAGVWKLEINDVIQIAGGTLISWGITFTPDWVPINPPPLSSLGTLSGGQWQANWDVKQTPPGVYDVRARVTSINNSTFTDVHTRIVVPNPVVDLILPPPNTVVRGQTPLEATVTNDAAVQRVEFQIGPPRLSFCRGCTTSLNKPLLDYRTATDSQQLSSAGVVGSASVSVKLTHEFIGDLQIALIHTTPQGAVDATVILQDRVSSDDQTLDTIFNNVPIEGKGIAGTWTLRISDLQAPDVGTFISWGMTIIPEFRSPPLSSSVTFDPVSKRWKATWNTGLTPPSLYDVRAVAVTAGTGLFADVHQNVRVESTAATTFAVSGAVRNTSGAGIANVRITISGNGVNSSTLTGADGTYTFNVPNGTYTIKPVSTTSPVLFFEPAQTAVNVNSADRPNINFIARPGFVVSGRVLNAGNNGVSGVNILRSTSSGANVVAATTDANGAYSFIVPAGTYRLTPSLSGRGFTPAFRDVTVTNANVTGQDFKLNEGFTVTGRVTTSAGAGVAGVTIKLDGAPATTTDSAGNYRLPNVLVGTHSVVPQQAGSAFTPPSQAVQITTADVANVNFVRIPGITGRVTESGTGRAVAGVTITRSATSSTPAATVSTDANGDYALPAPPGTYRITPTLSGRTFSPTFRDVTVGSTGAGVSGINFVANATTFAISGRVATIAGQGVAGVRVTRTGSTVAATTDANGNYVLTGVTAGTYTVTPSLTGRRFSPASQSVQVTSASRTGINFTDVTDTSAPTVTVARPISGATYNNTNAATSLTSTAGSASDNVSVVRVTARLFLQATSTQPGRFWAGGSTWTAAYNPSVNERPTTLDRPGTTSTNWSLALPVLPAGSYTFRATATDSSGITGIRELTFFISSSPTPRPATVSGQSAGSSSVGLSSVRAVAGSKTVVLTFTGALNGAVAADATHYAVTLNGATAAVANASYDAGGYRVTLALANGTLQTGDTVQVLWTGLVDQSGRELAAGSAQTIAR